MQLENKTFRLHIISQLFTGIAFGILMLQEVILKKSLNATDFEVTILIFLTSSAFLFSIYGSEIINRSNNQARTIIIMAVITCIFCILYSCNELHRLTNEAVMEYGIQT